MMLKVDPITRNFLADVWAASLDKGHVHATDRMEHLLASWRADGIAKDATEDEIEAFDEAFEAAAKD
jgi:hypothetical protein